MWCTENKEREVFLSRYWTSGATQWNWLAGDAGMTKWRISLYNTSLVLLLKAEPKDASVSAWGMEATPPPLGPQTGGDAGIAISNKVLVGISPEVTWPTKCSIRRSSTQGVSVLAPANSNLMHSFCHYCQQHNWGLVECHLGLVGGPEGMERFHLAHNSSHSTQTPKLLKRSVNCYLQAVAICGSFEARGISSGHCSCPGVIRNTDGVSNGHSYSW